MLLALWIALAGPVPTGSSQMLAVVTADADATSGLLYRFERDSGGGGVWRAIGEPVEVVVGERGLSAGAGLHRGVLPRLPVKAEGDGRSPAGVFALTEAFGLADEPPGLRLPYSKLRENVECVDDPESRDYGRVLRRGPAAAWTSSERMWENEDYDLGVVVAHNEARKPSAGSCTFLHTWSGSGRETPTTGSTAMAPSDMKTIVTWLDDDRRPVLVQLTFDLYRDLSIAWELPEAPLERPEPDGQARYK